MNNCINRLLLTVLLVPISGCSNHEQQAADDMTLRDFEQLVINGYIEPYKTGDTERWMEIFADDAVGMHNTLPALEGKQAIRQFAELVHSSFDIEQLDVTVDSVIREGTGRLPAAIIQPVLFSRAGMLKLRRNPGKANMYYCGNVKATAPGRSFWIWVTTTRHDPDDRPAQVSSRVFFFQPVKR